MHPWHLAEAVDAATSLCISIPPHTPPSQPAAAQVQLARKSVVLLRHSKVQPSCTDMLLGIPRSASPARCTQSSTGLLNWAAPATSARPPLASPRRSLAQVTHNTHDALQTECVYTHNHSMCPLLLAMPVALARFAACLPSLSLTVAAIDPFYTQTVKHST